MHVTLKAGMSRLALVCDLVGNRSSDKKGSLDRTRYFAQEKEIKRPNRDYSLHNCKYIEKYVRYRQPTYVQLLLVDRIACASWTFAKIN